MKKILLILLLIVGITVFTACGVNDDNNEGEVETVNYMNSVYPFPFADPSVVKDDDGYYYAFATGSSDGKWIQIIKSNDLVNWEKVGGALDQRPIWGTANANTWAPDIVKFGDTYNLYYSLSTWGDPNPGIGVATAPHPAGPWTDYGKMFNSLEVNVNNSIDSAVFFSEDGKPYMIWGSFRGLYGLELAENGLAFKSKNPALDRIHIAGFDTLTPHDVNTYEAPYIIFKDGFYYMFVSSGTCCEGTKSTYHVKVSRSADPLGPYLDDQGRSMLGAGRGTLVISKNDYFVGPGHNAVIKDDVGDYWMLYHGIDLIKANQPGGTTHRTLLIDKLIWEKGWPKVNYTMPSHKETIGPSISKSNK